MMASKYHVIKFMLALMLTSICGVVGADAAGEYDPSGVWLTQAGDARVQVKHCGGSSICGHVVWLRDPIDRATGRPQTDDKNENPSLRSRRIVGITLFSNMQAVAANKWSGTIYNADDGRSYASTVTLRSPATLEVQGCVGVFCGSETWTRANR
jgi:uncharacterized protein (DUF2147 family)